MTTGGELTSGWRQERSKRVEGRWLCEWECEWEEDEEDKLAEVAATTGKSKKERKEEGEKVVDDVITLPSATHWCNVRSS